MRTRDIIRTIALATIAGAIATTVQAGPGPEATRHVKSSKTANATRTVSSHEGQSFVVARSGGRANTAVSYTPSQYLTTIALAPRK